MGEYYFHLDQLTVGYNGKPLIDQIQVGIHKGEIVTLIGPNGSGKSTILKSITRQLKILGGKVLYEENDLHKLSYKELSTRMAVVLTERMRPELMTCHDIVATGRYPYTGRLGILSREDEDKVDEAMRIVHAEELGSRDFNAISDGQRQRVLLARAICQEPEIIILDEPTVGLDPKQIIEIRELIRKLAKKHTVILSSHILAEVREVCDYIMIISGGKLVASDTTENLENMMSGKGQIEVEAKASRDEMDHIIRRTGKIKEVKYRTSASGITTAQIIAKGGEDIREELFLAFSHADVPLLTLNQSKTTLEEIFLELTQGSGNRMIKEEK